MTKRVSYLSGCMEEAGSGFELSHAGSEVALSVRKDEIDHLDTVLDAALRAIDGRENFGRHATSGA